VHKELDRLGRPTLQRVSRAGEVLWEQRYEWEEGDRLRAATRQGQGRMQYTHDSRGYLTAAHLPGAHTEHRSPDALGNLYRSPDHSDRRYGPGGALLEADGNRYTYDADGNLIEKITSEGSRWQYGYDAAGQLRQVLRPDGTILNFSYDALGRRVAKRQEGREVRWLWDGDVPLHEFRSGEEPITWTFDPDDFTLLAKTQGEHRYAVVSDLVGTPLALHDESGHLAWRGELDVTGRARIEAAATSCPWRWPGQYEDEETGLYYNRFRYYDPAAGLYISQDPQGITGGLNLYAYTPDPLTLIDPYGLLKQWGIASYASSAHKGDGLDAHELLQSAWFEHNHKNYEGRHKGMGRQNPAIAVKPGIHARITAEQRRLGLHDPAVLKKQSALKNIEINAKILEKEMVKSGGMSRWAAKKKVKQLKMEAIAFAKKHGCK
jgi:RHS repeat-associated protein